MMQTVVYINGRFLSQVLAGVQRFSREITSNLASEDIAIRVLAPRNARVASIDVPVEIVGRNTGHLWEQYDLPRALRQRGDPLLLNFGNTAPLAYRNQVATLHDVAYLFYPKSYPLLFRLSYRLLIPHIIRRARAILTVSEFSKDEIARTYDMAPENISVVYNAADTRFIETNVDRRTDTLLVFASDSDQKNYLRVLNAFRKLTRTRTAHLRVMGESQRFDSPALLQSDGKSSITRLGRVDDETLVNEYRRATAFVFPPHYAGFGIPPVEAQSCGCPVIASRAKAIVEVLGDSAVYFESTDEDEIAAAMAKMLNNAQLRDRLRELGRQNAARFDWTASAEHIRHLIPSLTYERAFWESHNTADSPQG